MMDIPLDKHLVDGIFQGLELTLRAGGSPTFLGKVNTAFQLLCQLAIDDVSFILTVLTVGSPDLFSYL